MRRGNVILKTRPRDVEETLLQLINDDDPVTAAAAIDVVREQKMWSLADDVEHVLAHRDVKDWYVFEAASWTLAEQRMPAERRRELWLEPLPAAELAGRLRRLPLFASVSVDELFRIASASRQVRHEPGSVLTQEGAVPASIHILLDGRVATGGATLATARRSTRQRRLCFVEAMAGLPMPETIRTSGSAVTLALTVDELRTLLADNTDLVSGLFATLAERRGRTGHHRPPDTGRARAGAARDRRPDGDRSRLRAAVRAALPPCLSRRDAASRDGRGAGHDEGGLGALSGVGAAGALAAPDRRSRARELDGRAGR